MKMKYLVLALLIIILITGGVILLINKKKTTVNVDELDGANIKSFYLTYTNGYMMNAYTIYQITYENEKYLAKIKPYGVDEEDDLIIEVDEEFIKEIVNILKKYNVNKWNGFNKTDHGVLDGDSFSFSLTLNNDKEIEASGYMRWPENYRDVVNEISPLFMDIYNKEKDTK